MPSQNQNTMLLLHPSDVDPIPFLSRLTGSPVDNDPQPTDGADVNWTIDNKYYNADITIHPAPLGRSLDDTGTLMSNWRDVEVVVYIFEKVSSLSLPPKLIRLLSTPRDIALAIRTIPNTAANDEDGHDNGNDAVQVDEMFEEIGMEFIDEVNPMTEEDDERPMEPLEVIRQTLQTHMWPNMTRKPLNIATTSQIPSTISPSSSATSSLNTHIFPETFGTASGNTVPPIGPSGSSFPGLDELRAEIFKADYGDIDRLDKLDDEFGFGGAEPSQDEYARLDEWLDSDDEEDQGQAVYEALEDDADDNGAPSAPQNGSNDAFEHGSASNTPNSHGIADPSDQNGVHASGPSTNREGDWLDNDDTKFDPILSDLPSRAPSALPNIEQKERQEGFEDDFDDFAEYQSGPSNPARRPDLEDPTLALDPTPLLLHLQSVRAELAGVVDEDERRVRAGKEVQQILASLGVGDMGDDLGLDDI
uniref:Uncharacterized protein n=1 Tax=Kwoniella dejecticola CBS 10117 TaxID=1296121 RepID=A0A1A6AD76_9TREE|nr:uncharacterized protein I303_02233 [Kwoniella dejecticola CBS 10117]OBR88016.1 hypothetical protein I303_02233 [Kwoniella dejecticola CBS 10117]